MGGVPVGVALSALFFTSFGLWHLLASISTFLTSPTNFFARPWHPSPRLPPPLHRLHLLLLLLSVPLSIAYQLLVSTSFDPLVQGSTPVFRMATLLHASSLLFFALFASTALVSDLTNPSHRPLLPFLPPEAPFLLAAAAFAAQWKVLSFEAQITSGLEGECDSLLAAISAACAVVSGVLAWQPKLFLADLALGMALLFQGTWRLQVGLSLHIDAFIPQGCHRLLDVPGSVEGSTRCDVESLKTRAIALMDLLFICHAVFILLLTAALYSVVAKIQGSRRHVSHEENYILQMVPL